MFFSLQANHEYCMAKYLFTIRIKLICFIVMRKNCKSSGSGDTTSKYMMYTCIDKLIQAELIRVTCSAVGSS